MKTMAFIGVSVTSTESPTANPTTFFTGNCFVIGLGDWGAPSGKNAPVVCRSVADAVGAIGPRSNTNATLYDSLETFFHESAGTGAVAYVTRVVGPNPTAAAYVMKDGSNATAVTVTANYTGAYGNALKVAYQSSVVTLSDSHGSTLATSGTLSSNATIAAWLTATGYVTAVAGAGAIAATITATALSGGDDDRTNATLANWQNALNTFDVAYGPGQVIAPGASDWDSPPLVGISAALGQHALNYNRCAIVDLPDNTAASTLISDISTTFGNAASGPMAFWAGDQLIPGIVGGTTRTVPPSPIIAGQCAQVDAAGNPNRAAANLPLNSVTGPASYVTGSLATYSLNDLYKLDDAGINAFANRYGRYVNYNFTSTIPATTDPIFTQFNHERMRMALQAQAQILGEPYVMAQLDGQGTALAGFANAITSMLKSYYDLGALYGNTADEAFTVDVGSSVNTPTTLQAGQLNAKVNVRFSPYAKHVSVVLNAVSITQALSPVAA